MGKVAVQINNGNGSQFGGFEWQGDDAAITNINKEMEKLADRAGVSPEAVAHSVLRRLPEMGLLEDEGPRQLQMMAVLWIVLHSETPELERGGPVYLYAATEDISAVLTLIDEKRWSVELQGRYFDS